MNALQVLRMVANLIQGDSSITWTANPSSRPMSMFAITAGSPARARSSRCADRMTPVTTSRHCP
jgi:hypothetical protein